MSSMPWQELQERKEWERCGGYVYLPCTYGRITTILCCEVYTVGYSHYPLLLIHFPPLPLFSSSPPSLPLLSLSRLCSFLILPLPLPPVLPYSFCPSLSPLSLPSLPQGCGPTVVRAMVVNAAQLATYSQAKQLLLGTGKSSVCIKCTTL